MAQIAPIRRCRCCHPYQRRSIGFGRGLRFRFRRSDAAAVCSWPERWRRRIRGGRARPWPSNASCR